MMGSVNTIYTPVHPTPAWAVYRDTKTGQLVRKYHLERRFETVYSKDGASKNQTTLMGRCLAETCSAQWCSITSPRTTPMSAVICSSVS